MTIRMVARVLLVCVFLPALAIPARGGEIAKEDLVIQGLGLEVLNTNVQANLDTPSYVQTKFGGRTGDEVIDVPEGLVARGELVGPGILTPITLSTSPGRQFQIPGLSKEGTYFLQNVRLERNGAFVQPAVPSLAVIDVLDVFETRVSIKQLTATDLRNRGILIDSRNYDV